MTPQDIISTYHDRIEVARTELFDAINQARSNGVSWETIAGWGGWSGRQAAWEWHRRETERRT